MNIETLQNLLQQGQDNKILRFGLGHSLLKANRASEAIVHFKTALEFDPDYSAAWKLLGKSLAESGEIHEAIDTYSKGIAIAENKGDIQAVKEMRVFLKRLQKLI